MTDYNLPKNDIQNRFTPTSLDDASDGAGWVATSVISAVTTNSEWKMSQFDAYENLRQKLVNGDEDLLYQSTTAQRDALDPLLLEDTTMIYNITVGRKEVRIGTQWRNVSRRSNLTNITASTTQTQGQGLIIADLNVFNTVTNNNDTATLPPAVEGLNPIIIVNRGEKKMKIFPNTDDDLGEGSNNAISLAAGSAISFNCSDATNWIVI